MASAGASELAWQLALPIGLGCLVLAALMSAQVLLLRLLMRGRDRHRAALERTWLPLLARAALGDALPATLPTAFGADRLELALLWLRMQGCLRGSAHRHLNAMAERVGLHVDARRWSAPRRANAAERRVGLAMLGYLATAGDIALLRKALQDPLPGVGLAAAHALLRVDPEASVGTVMDTFDRRPDWSAADIGMLLRDARSPALVAGLVDRLLAGPAGVQRRLLPLLTVTETPHQQSVVSRLARESSDPQVLAMAMRRVHDPTSATRVRELARHADPLVRSAAAQALGQMGVDQDADLLMEMMADLDWWVRHRAAQARVRLPSAQREDLPALRLRLVDRYARDALAHAVAERSWAREAGRHHAVA